MNASNLAEHMACYLMAHPSLRSRLGATILDQANPDLCRAIAEALPSDTMGEKPSAATAVAGVGEGNDGGEAVRITITIKDDTLPATACRVAAASIEHWQHETAQGKPWSQGAIITFGSGVATSTQKTCSGWVVWVWSEKKATGVNP